MDKRQWPARLRMARVPDSPSWFVSVCDTPPQEDDKEYVLADWIFVDDRLPEPLDYVLCLIQSRHDPNTQFYDVGWRSVNEDGHEWHVCEMMDAPVIAWMPLPSPPTAEQIAAYRTRTEGAPSYDD